MLTVSQLHTQVKKLLNNNFPLVVVEGEVSGLHHHRASGHYYFNLKDERSVLRCVMFAGSAAKLSFQPEDGLKVLVRAEISLYERAGQYQAVIQHMEPHGEGELRLAMERLRAKLLAMGWFEDELKKPLPEFPQRIVIVSSPKAAATRDVVVNIWRRYPPVELLIQPTAVQGQLAVSEICNALAKINQLTERPDLAILTRGGGSLEDLAAFNSEQVAAAIFESEIPIVSAVGHDVDFTIADFVADKRAPTPSTAAEIVTPDARNLGIRFDENATRLEKATRTMVSRHKSVVAHITRRVRDPRRDLATNRKRLNDRIKSVIRTQNQILSQQGSQLNRLQHSLNQAKPSARLQHYHTKLNSAQAQISQIVSVQNRENTARLSLALKRLLQLETRAFEMTDAQLQNLRKTLIQARPDIRINHLQSRLEGTRARLEFRVGENIQAAKNRVSSIVKNIEAVSPLAVLSRGYAVVSKPMEGTIFGKIAKSVDDLRPNENIETHLSDGTISSKISLIVKKENRDIE